MSARQLLLHRGCLSVLSPAARHLSPYLGVAARLRGGTTLLQNLFELGKSLPPHMAPLATAGTRGQPPPLEPPPLLPSFTQHPSSSSSSPCTFPLLQCVQLVSEFYHQPVRGGPLQRTANRSLPGCAEYMTPETLGHVVGLALHRPDLEGATLVDALRGPAGLAPLARSSGVSLARFGRLVTLLRTVAAAASSVDTNAALGTSSCGQEDPLPPPPPQRMAAGGRGAAAQGRTRRAKGAADVVAATLQSPPPPQPPLLLRALPQLPHMVVMRVLSEAATSRRCFLNFWLVLDRHYLPGQVFQDPAFGRCADRQRAWCDDGAGGYGDGSGGVGRQQQLHHRHHHCGNSSVDNDGASAVAFDKVVQRVASCEGDVADGGDGDDLEAMYGVLGSTGGAYRGHPERRFVYRGQPARADCVEVVVRELVDTLLWCPRRGTFDVARRLPATAPAATRAFYEAAAAAAERDNTGGGGAPWDGGRAWYDLCQELRGVRYMRHVGGVTPPPSPPVSHPDDSGKGGAAATTTTTAATTTTTAFTATTAGRGKDAEDGGDDGDNASAAAAAEGQYEVYPSLDNMLALTNALLGLRLSSWGTARAYWRRHAAQDVDLRLAGGPDAAGRDAIHVTIARRRGDDGGYGDGGGGGDVDAVDGEQLHHCHHHHHHHHHEIDVLVKPGHHAWAFHKARPPALVRKASARVAEAWAAGALNPNLLPLVPLALSVHDNADDRLGDEACTDPSSALFPSGGAAAATAMVAAPAAPDDGVGATAVATRAALAVLSAEPTHSLLATARTLRICALSHRRLTTAGGASSTPPSLPAPVLRHSLLDCPYTSRWLAQNAGRCIDGDDIRAARGERPGRGGWQALADVLSDHFVHHHRHHHHATAAAPAADDDAAAVLPAFFLLHLCAVRSASCSRFLHPILDVGPLRGHLRGTAALVSDVRQLQQRQQQQQLQRGQGEEREDAVEETFGPSLPFDAISALSPGDALFLAAKIRGIRGVRRWWRSVWGQG